MPSNAELQTQVAELTKARDKLENKVAKLTGELTTERERANTNAAARQDLDRQLEERDTELRSLNASLKAFKGSATKAKAQATVLKKQLSPDRRRIGAPKASRHAGDADARAAALEDAFKADTTELVFSDGAHEIRELAPLVVNGDAWRQLPHFRQLNHEPMLEPGDMQRESVTVRGIGLLNEAGEQVGWCHLHEPVTIGRNQRVMLSHGSVRF